MKKMIFVNLALLIALSSEAFGFSRLSNFTASDSFDLLVGKKTEVSIDCSNVRDVLKKHHEENVELMSIDIKDLYSLSRVIFDWYNTMLGYVPGNIYITRDSIKGIGVTAAEVERFAGKLKDRQKKSDDSLKEILDVLKTCF